MNISYQEFNIILPILIFYILACFLIGEWLPPRKIDTRMLFVVQERISQ